MDKEIKEIWASINKIQRRAENLNERINGEVIRRTQIYSEMDDDICSFKKEMKKLNMIIHNFDKRMDQTSRYLKYDIKSLEKRFDRHELSCVAHEV